MHRVGAVAQSFERRPISERAFPHNLPIALSSFVGRIDERDHVARVLDTARLVTLAGAPGVGKTRLALEVAAEVVGARPDGVWLVEMATLSEPEQVPQAIATVLGVPERPGVDLAAGIAEELAGKRLLLVLDNCEHLLDATARVTATLLRGCAGLVVLATSREPLGIDGENVWRVQPFATPPESERGLDALLGYSAVRLFVERATRVQAGFCLTAGDASWVVEVCRLLDGVPLAIELAAARMDVLSPREIVQHLGQGLRLLGTRGRSEPSMHKSLEATLDWSSKRLLPDEATLLGRLTVFAGSWSLEAAEAICSGGDIPAEDVLGLLDGLVRKSLVTADVGDGETRYRLIGIIRDHAGRRLGDFAERTTLNDAHCLWYVDQAARAHVDGSEMRLDADRENLRSAFDWAMSQGRTETALTLAASLVFFWQGRGELEEGRRWLVRALGGRGGGPPLLRAQALCSAGLLQSLAGDASGAVPLAEESLALANEHGDVSLACRAKSLLALLSTLGSPLDSLQLLQSTVALAREQGDVRFLRSSLDQLGVALVLVGDAPAARLCLGESLSLARELGDIAAEAGVLATLGRAAVAAGDLAVAEAQLRDALELNEALGEHGDLANILSWLGEVARGRGQLPLAKELLGEALSLARQAVLSPLIARCLCLLGHVALAERDLDGARARLLDGLALARRNGRSYLVARCLLGLGEAALQDGDGAASRAHLEEALALARSTGDRQAVAAALHGLGQVAAETASLERAMALYHEALSMRERIDDRAGLASSLERVALLASAEGRDVDAARLLAAAQALRDAGGYARSSTEDAAREVCIAQLRLSLGEVQLGQEWAKGSTLSAHEAVAYATRKGTQGRPSKRWASLTPAEHDVACLAVQGLTSREIAERLFVSPRTVGAHLGHVYEKLGIGSRRELRSMAADEQLPLRQPPTRR